ncbi:MAG: FtsX-like permease family protein [Schaedlerella sp.]|nr:FtsX-like permease family protein [Schaedlerella sp.]
MWNKRFSKSQKVFHSKHLNSGIGIILFLIFLLGMTIVVYTDSYETTLMNHRKQTYGSWHAAFYNTNEETYQEIADHATINITGTMSVFASIYDETETIIGGLGYVNDALVNIGNLQLLDGNFPVNDNEIAIEASYLTRLGYSYELDQDITLSLLYTNENGEIKNDIRTFSLCGILKNYSEHWKTNTNQMVSFFTTPEFCQNNLSSAPISFHVFSKLDSAYENNVDSLSVFCKNIKNFVKNDYVYKEYSDNGNSSQNSDVLQTVILLVGCISIVILINNDIMHKRNTFITMRLIGAKRIQIIKLFFKDKFPVILVSSLLGIICGILLPYFVIIIINKIFLQTLSFHLSMIHSLKIILFFGIGIISALTFGMIRLFQIPLRGKPQQQSSIKNIPRYRRNLNRRNIFSVLNSINKPKKICSILLTAITAVFIFLSTYETWMDFNAYRLYCKNYPEDYSFGMISYFETDCQMTKETLNQIQSVYGVKEIQTISVSDYYDIAFSNDVDEKYTQNVFHYLQNIIGDKTNLKTPLWGSVFGISDNLHSLYINEVDTKSLNDSALNKNEILLYLPNFYQLDNGKTIPADLATAEEKSGTIIKNHMIQPGESVQFKVNEQEYTLTITGIIYSFEEDTSVAQNPIRPYSLICSKETYYEIFGNYNPSYVAIYSDASAIPYQTDIELSKIQTDLYFNNKRIERSEQKQQLLIHTILTIILGVSGFLMTVMIRFGIYITSAKQDFERYRTLYQIGMKKSSLLHFFIRNAIYDSMIGSTIAVIVLCIYRFLEEKMILLSAENYILTNTSQFYLNIFQRVFFYTDWYFITCIFIVVSFINYILIFIYDYYSLYYKDTLY